jgi:hypothetical protein
MTAETKWLFVLWACVFCPVWILGGLALILTGPIGWAVLAILAAIVIRLLASKPSTL